MSVSKRKQQYLYLHVEGSPRPKVWASFSSRSFWWWPSAPRSPHQGYLQRTEHWTGEPLHRNLCQSLETELEMATRSQSNTEKLRLTRNIQLSLSVNAPQLWTLLHLTLPQTPTPCPLTRPLIKDCECDHLNVINVRTCVTEQQKEDSCWKNYLQSWFSEQFGPERRV